MKEHALIRIPHENEPIAIGPGETYFRDFELAAGELLHLAAHQRGIDVAVRLLDPAGEVLIQVDSPTGTEGTEELVQIARSQGVHRFEIVAPEKDVTAGQFVFQVLAHRDATAADRDLFLADRSYHDARSLLRQGKYRQAIPKLRGALEVWIRLERIRRQADTRHALCRAHQYLNQGDLAIAYCEQALASYRALDDRLMTAVVLYRAGAIRQRLGQVRRALGYSEEALSLFRELGKERDLALTLASLGTAHHRLGDFRQALDAFERALPAIEGAAASTTAHAGVLLSRGVVSLELNRPRDALDHFDRAEEIYRGLHDDRRLARVLNRSAVATIRLGELDEAEEDLAEAIGILQAQEKQGRKVERDLAISHLCLGRVQARKRQLTEARTAVRRGLELSRQAGDRQLEANGLLDLGHLLVLEQKPVEGLRQLDQAFDLFTEVEDLVGQTIVRIRSAGALRDLGRLDQAWRRIAPALDVVERFRSASDRSDIRTDYFAFRQDFFEIAIDVLMGMHAREPDADYHVRALEVHERRRARELLDVLTEAAVVSRRDVDAALLAEERRLEEELRALTGAAEVQDLDQKVGHLVDRLRQVRGEIRRAARREVAVPASAPVGLAQIRESVLDEDSLILAYSLAEARSYLWSISPATVRVHELPPRRVIEDLARQLAGDLRRRRKRARDPRARAARELSDILLAPAAAELGGSRLIVVPAGELQHLPFAALPAPGTAGDGEYLIRRHEIVILPSISSVVSLRRAQAGREAAKRSIAAFADPVFRSDDPRVRALTEDEPALETPTSGAESEDAGQERALLRLGFDPYQRLRYSRDEVDAILALVPAAESLLAVDFAASRETFIEHELAGYRIPHFATHAFQDQAHPELAGLVLSLVDEQGRPRDGFLRAFEISRLHLPVELVVLSACQTGRGKNIPGEGVMGLTRAFFDAGAMRVVSSLWPVSDRSTASLMKRLYQAHLGSGLAPAAALRQAQLSMLEDPATAVPFHWAGFVFQGEWRQALPAQTSE